MKKKLTVYAGERYESRRKWKKIRCRDLEHFSISFHYSSFRYITEQCGAPRANARSLRKFLSHCEHPPTPCSSHYVSRMYKTNLIHKQFGVSSMQEQTAKPVEMKMKIKAGKGWSGRQAIGLSG